jgi:hypothetical protein
MLQNPLHFTAPFLLSSGVIELSQLRQAVARRRGPLSDPVSEDDVVRAIRKLKVGLLLLLLLLLHQKHTSPSAGPNYHGGG